MIANAETSFTEENFLIILYPRLPRSRLGYSDRWRPAFKQFHAVAICHSELWVTPHCWPEFNKQLLLKAIEDFNARDRKYGVLMHRISKNFFSVV